MEFEHDGAGHPAKLDRMLNRVYPRQSGSAQYGAMQKYFRGGKSGYEVRLF